MRYIPLVFVVLWATGFIAAKWGLPYAEPFTFLALRMALVVPIFLLLARVLKRAPLSWVERRDQMLVGLGTHGIYLGGVFFAIEHRMPAGIVALIVGTQPLLTALIGQFFLHKRLARREWVGVSFGLAGITIVLLQGGKLEGSLTLLNVSAAIVALVGMSLATLWQSYRGGSTDLVAGGFWQYLAALGLFVILAAVLEQNTVEWTMAFVGAWLWSVFVLSLVAILLWLYMLRHGEAARVTQYMYLSPPTTAVMAAILFSEPLTLQTGLGAALVVLGLYLARRPLRQPNAAGKSPGTAA